jgi:flagellar M-ring protein FliF
MNQLTQIWNRLSITQRISLIAMPILVCAAAWGLVRWKHDSDFRTLYSGLSPEDAAAVTQKLREAAIEFRLDETGAAVLVPSGSLSEARLSLAGAGLPRTGRIGFELFDRVNLGASDFTEQVNYRRALEGELERTVARLSEVDQARIHITFAKESVFLDARQPSKATVVLRLKRAPQISNANVTAIANLMASAVDGLAPESVAIVDSSGRLLNRPRAAQDNDSRLAEANLDYRHQMETDFLTKINAAVEPLVGPGKFHAGVSVDCDFTSAEENEESYDAAKSMVVNSQTTEESTASALTGGTPGTASNLPQPPPRSPGGTSGVMRRTESLSYQPGRTVRRTITPKGTIRRVSTSVLVDQMVRWEGIGPKAKKSVVPPSAEVMKGIHDVIAGITGFNEQRGDQITVETLPFESTVSAEPPPATVAPSKPGTNFTFRQPTVMGGVAVALVMLLFTGFLLRRRASHSIPVDIGGLDALDAGASAPSKIAAGESADARLEKQILENEAEQSQIESDALSRIKLPANTKKTEVLVKHIRESVQKDPGGAANVLRTWVSELESGRKS